MLGTFGTWEMGKEIRKERITRKIIQLNTLYSSPYSHFVHFWLRFTALSAPVCIFNLFCSQNTRWIGNFNTSSMINANRQRGGAPHTWTFVEIKFIFMWHFYWNINPKRCHKNTHSISHTHIVSSLFLVGAC